MQRRTSDIVLSSLVHLYYSDLQHQPRKMSRIEKTISSDTTTTASTSAQITTQVEKHLGIGDKSACSDNLKHPPQQEQLKHKQRCSSTSSCSDTSSQSCCSYLSEEEEDDSQQQPQSKRLDRKASISNRSTATSTTSSSTTTAAATVSTKEETQSTCTSIHSLHPNKCPHDMSPDTYIQKLFQILMNTKTKPRIRPTLEVSSICPTGHPDHPFIPPITEEEQANYDTELVSTVRENDLSGVKALHINQGRSLSCCNRFGESLLHMACRRGFESIVLYLIQTANVSVRITDDCGRTPLHDALWHKECQYVILDLLVRTDPVLLLTCDKRGHSPFAYARREHWANWRQFLWDRREHMKHVLNIDELELFS